MIDTHCHLNDSSYDEDRDKVIQLAFAEGVEYIVVPATSIYDFEKTINIAESNDRIYCAIGVHPHSADQVQEETLERIRNFARHKKVVAIGEIGLDYYYNYSSQQQQLCAFESQINIARDMSLPIIIHNRNSDEDMVKVLEKFNFRENNGESDKVVKGVFHCFSSDITMLKKILDVGLFVSFTANITFPKNKVDDIISYIPLDKVMLETDSPYMTPPPNRGKRNIPQNVLKVAEKISLIKNISIKEVIEMTALNAKKFFSIPMLIFAIIFGSLLVNPILLFSQTGDGYDDYIDVGDDYDEDDEQPDPFFRKLGFGPLFGTNTIVDRYTTGVTSFSNDGILAMGGVIQYRILNNIVIQAAYSYSENTKPKDRLADSLKDWIDYSYHKTAELSMIYLLTPKKIVNFYGSIGATYFMNKISRNFPESIGGEWRKSYYYDNKVGLNAGIGAFVNFSLGSAGTIAINAEWKLGFRLDHIDLEFDPRVSPDSEEYIKGASYSQMFSIPRGGIIWYVPLFK